MPIFSKLTKALWSVAGLVVDPRPTNAAWGDPPPVRLTSGPLLARQLQRQGQHGGARLLKSDLSDFYYNLRVPSWMAQTGPSFS